MAPHEGSPDKGPRPRWVLPVVQAAFLGLFIVLHLVGSTRIWLFVLIAGLIASPFLGRVYCRTACPVNACNRLLSSLPWGMRPPRRRAPAWIGHPIVRAAWFSILCATLVAALILRARFHLFTIITVLGIILCRAFPAAVWCNGLCPWGALFACTKRRLSSRAMPSLRSAATTPALREHEEAVQAAALRLTNDELSIRTCIAPNNDRALITSFRMDASRETDAAEPIRHAFLSSLRDCGGLTIALPEEPAEGRGTPTCRGSISHTSTTIRSSTADLPQRPTLETSSARLRRRSTT